MRPDPQLAGLLGLDAGRRAASPTQYLLSTPRRRARQGHRGRDDPVPRHRRPLDASGAAPPSRPSTRTPTHGDDEPGRHAPQRRYERRAGRRVHVRPRPLDRLHPPGQPRLGRPGARRHGARAVRRSLLRAAATRSPTGSTSTRSAIPQADELQRLLANLILKMNEDRKPLPRFWYFPKGKKAVVVMTGDQHGCCGTHAKRASRPTSGQSPRLLGGRLGLRPGQLVRLHQHRHGRHRGARRGRDQGFELGLHLNTGCAGLHARAARTRCSRSQLAALDAAVAEPAAPGLAPDALHRLERLDDQGRDGSSRSASASTPTTTTGPASWIANRPASSPAPACRCASPQRRRHR